MIDAMIFLFAFYKILTTQITSAIIWLEISRGIVLRKIKRRI